MWASRTPQTVGFERDRATESLGSPIEVPWVPPYGTTIGDTLIESSTAESHAVVHSTENYSTAMMKGFAFSSKT